MEPQKIPNSHLNLEKEEQSWRCHTTLYQSILQGYSNKKQHGTGIKTDI